MPEENNFPHSFVFFQGPPYGKLVERGTMASSTAGIKRVLVHLQKASEYKNTHSNAAEFTQVNYRPTLG